MITENNRVYLEFINIYEPLKMTLVQTEMLLNLSLLNVCLLYNFKGAVYRF